MECVERHSVSETFLFSSALRHVPATLPRPWLLRGKRGSQAPVAAADSPALRSRGGREGELPAVTTKPTIVRMLVCHGGVSLFGCELYFLPPCESRIIYFGSLRISSPLPLFKASLSSLPLLPVPPPPHTPNIFLSEQAFCNEILCLRTMAFAKVTCTVSVQLIKMSLLY